MQERPRRVLDFSLRCLLAEVTADNIQTGGDNSNSPEQIPLNSIIASPKRREDWQSSETRNPETKHIPSLY